MERKPERRKRNTQRETGRKAGANPERRNRNTNPKESLKECPGERQEGNPA